jgi:hypothetical protein
MFMVLPWLLNDETTVQVAASLKRRDDVHNVVGADFQRIQCGD